MYMQYLILLKKINRCDSVCVGRICKLIRFSKFYRGSTRKIDMFPKHSMYATCNVIIFKKIPDGAFFQFHVLMFTCDQSLTSWLKSRSRYFATKHSRYSSSFTPFLFCTHHILASLWEDLSFISSRWTYFEWLCFFWWKFGEFFSVVSRFSLAPWFTMYVYYNGLSAAAVWVLEWVDVWIVSLWPRLHLSDDWIMAHFIDNVMVMERFYDIWMALKLVILRDIGRMKLRLGSVMNLMLIAMLKTKWQVVDV